MKRFFARGLVSLVLGASSAVHAQTPPPPTGYATASLTPDVVLEPLLTAAEADLGRGEAALALARATAVSAAVPPDGPTHVRAEGLILVARQRLCSTPAAEVLADVALAPLVDAAALDGPAGRAALARARIEFVLARVAASTALATRATGLRAALDAQAPIVTTAPPVVTAPTVTTAPYQPIYGAAPTSAPTYVYTAPGQPQTRPAPEDPRRRGTGEIVELYITGGLFGGYVGAWIPWGAGLFETAAGDDRARLTTVGVFLGAGVMALSVFGLDQIDGGLRTGVPAGISMGIRYGLGLGALSLGIYGAANGVSTPTAMNVIGFAGLGGAVLGGGLALGLEAHPSQVQFVQAAGLWGAFFGAQLAMLIAPLLALDSVSGPFGSFPASQTRQEVGFGLATGGLSAGLLAGLIFSAAHLNPSARRSWLMTLGVIAGTGAGTALWSLISAIADEFDVPTLGGCQLVGALAGLILVGVMTSGDHERANWDEPGDDVPSVQLTIAPMQGGGTLGFAGTF